ncbi:hypothetical protein [Amnibacterium soli]|uniref:hypothetical protein n=1 Tax=Amnibacterium soli TaxID=1282736 RepID=UPI0031E5C100
MEFAGYLAEDAPDPRGAQRARVARLGVASAGLVPQRHLEDLGVEGIAASRSSVGTEERVEEVSLSRSYTLWRNPDDHADPVNLRKLDDATARALEEQPLFPVPAWLDEARDRLRHPSLWEAVQTHWIRPGGEPRSVADRLIAHAEHVLTNVYREELGLHGDAYWAPPVPPAALQRSRVIVDGAARDALLLDTDPFVLALGTELDDGRVLTAVIPREELPFVVREFLSDIPEPR